MPYYLSRLTPFDSWRVVTVQPTEGEWVELPPTSTYFFSQAQAEADRRNGKGDAQQETLPI